jgi:uncharacterized protein YjbI with pentapeptide repeats
MDFKDITLNQLMDMIQNNDARSISQILLNHKNEWNRLMEKNRRLNHRLHIRGLTVTQADLKDVDLSDMDIEDSDFSGSDLSNADFEDSTITKTNMSYSNLTETNMSSARMSQTSLSRARLYRVNMSETYITGSVDLFDTELTEEEQLYRTSPESTRRGFELAEMYEHSEYEGHDHEDSGPEY